MCLQYEAFIYIIGLCQTSQDPLRAGCTTKQASAPQPSVIILHQWGKTAQPSPSSELIDTLILSCPRDSIAYVPHKKKKNYLLPPLILPHTNLFLACPPFDFQKYIKCFVRKIQEAKMYCHCVVICPSPPPMGFFVLERWTWDFRCL